MSARNATAFVLRLPTSTKARATEAAKEDGTSLNHFISMAVAEKLSRLEQKALRTAGDPTKPDPTKTNPQRLTQRPPL